MGDLAAPLIAASSCAPVHVNTYVPRGLDVARYQTYTWAPEDQLITGDPRLDDNRMFLESLQADVEKRLGARGFTKAPPESATLVLHYHVSVGQNVDWPYRDPIDGRCNNCEPFIYEVGTLVLDFVDPQTNDLVWRGWADGAIEGVINNQDWMEETIDNAVRRIVERLPRPL